MSRFLLSPDRRVFVGLIGTAGAVWTAAAWRSAQIVRPPEFVRIADFNSAGERLGTTLVPVIVKSDSEWKRQLAVDQFWMTRRADTELAYAGEYWNFHGDGIYRCVCCATALFDSTAKFESGTGWPSFRGPMARENVRELDDRSFAMWRTEVRCRRCEAHQGHVFDDGPAPEGKRYCVNSTGLRFHPRDLT